MAQGSIASLGFTMYAIPDPSTGYSANTEIPTGSYKTIADHSSGTVNGDWYAAGVVTSVDRGWRLTNPINYFDGGDSRPNYGGLNGPIPTDPVVPGTSWQSPAPDGHGRWIYGDSYHNTGLWLDGASKHGFIAIASLGYGRCWYCVSQVCTESRVFELHIFDPANLGAAASGTLSPWKVQPSSMTQLTLPGLGASGDHSWEYSYVWDRLNITGAAFDSVGKRLFLLGPAGGGLHVNRIYVFGVNI
jgi:hypothetical protein